MIDPTLLLTPEDYSDIVEEPEISTPYLLLYSRRHDEKMQEFAEEIASENGWQIVEISLNARNADKHTMRYDAGVEEFLGLVKGASMVVTNSFHGMIFAVKFKRPFYIFSRKLCDTKISELLEIFGIEGRLLKSGCEPNTLPIDYDEVHKRISDARKDSLSVLREELNRI